MVKMNFEVELSVADILSIVKEVASIEREAAKERREDQNAQIVKNEFEKASGKLPEIVKGEIKTGIASAISDALPKIIEAVGKVNATKKE